MGKWSNTSTGDVYDVPDELDAMYESRPEFEPVATLKTSDDEVLKGAALDDALDQAGLPKTGTADEKRARLDEHLSKENANG